MLSQMYFNFCVSSWCWFAQTPLPGSPAAPATVPAEAPVGAPPVTTIPDIPGMGGTPMVVHSTTYSIAHSAALFFYFLICIALIACVTMQTTKNEGLSGVIGGQVQSSVFRGKKSAEETLSLWTTRLAIGFIVYSLGMWLAFGR